MGWEGVVSVSSNPIVKLALKAISILAFLKSIPYFCTDWYFLNPFMESKAARTRQFIIECAAPIFNKKGYAGTSLQDLLQATGLSKGALYGNFANKDEIALAVFDYNFNFIKKSLIQRTAQTDSTVEKFLAMLQFYRKEWTNLVANGGCPLLNAAVEADDNLPMLQARVHESFQYWQRSLEKLMLQGMLQGELRTDLNPSQQAVLIMSLLEGGILIAKATSQSQAFDTCLQAIEGLIQNMKNNA